MRAEAMRAGAASAPDNMLRRDMVTAFLHLCPVRDLDIERQLSAKVKECRYAAALRHSDCAAPLPGGSTQSGKRDFTRRGPAPPRTSIDASNTPPMEWWGT